MSLFAASLRRFALILSTVVLCAPSAFAADYPAHPVHIIVPFAPGGGTDLITRTLADIIAKEWNATIVIDNKPGGGTTIGAMAVATAPADGYTLLATSNSFLLTPMMLPAKPYVWDRDFTGVSLFAVSPHILVVNPAVPAHTLDEFAAWAKTQNGNVSFASFGSGSSNHLGFEVLRRKLGIEMVHVPYKGSAPALNDLLAGHVQAMLGDIQNVSGQITAGSLRPLAVANEKRLAAMPDLPTIDELGVKGFTSKSWFGAVMRKDTPPEIVAKWGAAFAEALRRPDVKARLAPLGVELAGYSPEQMQQFLTDEAAKGTEAVKTSGATME